MRYYGEESPDESDSQRNPEPYVYGPQGPQRKIGPKARYGMNANTGDQVQASQRQKTSTRLGTPHRATESNFSRSMREADDQTAANAAYLKSKEGKPAEKKAAPSTAAETPTNRHAAPFESAKNAPKPKAGYLGDVIGSARDAAMKQRRRMSPYRPAGS